MFFKTVCLFITLLSATEAAKILGVFPMAGISHQILASKLMKGLAEAGHDITMVSPYLEKELPMKGTYTEILLEGFEEEMKQILKHFNLYKMEEMDIVGKMKISTKLFMNSINNTINYPKMKDLVESGQKFDAVIMAQFSNDAIKVYGHLFNCPLIILSSQGPNAWVNPTVGNPQIPSYMPHTYFEKSTTNWTFTDRAQNLLLYIVGYLLDTFYTMPKHDKMIQATYPNSPPIWDLYTNVSLVLLNSHTSINPALPTVPNMIEVGGYFIDPPKKLPEDLQEYMDDAPHGVIYFSMGSNLKSSNMPEEQKQAILNVFGKLKQKVIWKFEEDLPERPSNVMIRKWCPQSDILAHPNTVLFISHGGLLSTTETVYHGVPILAIPVFADQPANADRAEAHGYGLKLSYHDFEASKFEYLINELLSNPKYTETAREKSKLYHDRPMKPMDTVVYWVEYVIRHKGAPHLRVAGIRLPWYQYFMADVIGSVVLGIFVLLCVVKCVFKKLICKRSTKNISKKQKLL